MNSAPVIYWMRRDFRLADNPALTACKGRPVIPVFIRDETVDGLGAAPKFRLSRAVAHFSERLAAEGATLILRRGDPIEVLRALIAETGATGVVWNRLYDPAALARDTRVKAALKAEGHSADSYNAHLLFEPWTVATGAGGSYRVYSPFWRAVRGRDVAPPLQVPSVEWAKEWPESETLSDWQMEAAMNRGGVVLSRHLLLGENAARARLSDFMADKVVAYDDDRDQMDRQGTSGLSEHLAVGEISPRSCWHAGIAGLQGSGNGAETFLKELVWREFAYHLHFHFPEMAKKNWREGWDAFPWRGNNADALKWQRGQTGLPMIDAAMRELYVTGKMHNRARMLVASYLTKHLMTDWHVGLAWFADTLVDWDPASNAMGWQWVAGSGPDASPFFRIFNPETQAAKFDPKGRYQDHWLLGEGAKEFAAAIPRSWPNTRPTTPVMGLSEGRLRALEAYKTFKG